MTTIDPDWPSVKAAALAKFGATPWPTEDTIEACAQALKAEGFKTLNRDGQVFSVDEMQAALAWELHDWQGLLHAWRYFTNEENAQP